jgi:hypothetical protein
VYEASISPQLLEKTNTAAASAATKVGSRPTSTVKKITMVID